MPLFKCVKSKVRIGSSSEESDDTKASGADSKQRPLSGAGSPDSEGFGMPLPSPTHSDVQFVPDPSHFQLLTVIGQGCEGTVPIYLAQHLPSGNYVAVKLVHLDQLKMDLDLLQHEIRMQKLLKHESILNCLCTFIHLNDIWIVLPLMAYGSSKDLLQAHFTEGLSETAIAYILRDILRALEYLHTFEIIHRSVRASHILISTTGKVCLSGFKHTYSMIKEGKRSKAVHDFPNCFQKNLNCSSPELLQQNLEGYSTKSDIYSVGILACELANGAEPFSDKPATMMLLEKLDGLTPQLLDISTVPELQAEISSGNNSSNQTDSGFANSVAMEGLRRGSLPYQRTFSSHFHHFVSLCLMSNRQLRPSATILLQHNFFKQVRRKSSLDSLPDLLRPVLPLTSTLVLNPEKTAVEEITTQAEQLQLNDEYTNCDPWTF